MKDQMYFQVFAKAYEENLLHVGALQKESQYCDICYILSHGSGSNNGCGKFMFC